MDSLTFSFESLVTSSGSGLDKCSGAFALSEKSNDARETPLSLTVSTKLLKDSLYFSIPFSLMEFDVSKMRATLSGFVVHLAALGMSGFFFES